MHVMILSGHQCNAQLAAHSQRVCDDGGHDMIRDRPPAGSIMLFCIHEAPRENARLYLPHTDEARFVSTDGLLVDGVVG